MERFRKTVIVAAAAVVLGAAAYTVTTALNSDTVQTASTEQGLLAHDVSKDEYLAHASTDIFHGVIVALASQARTDQPGEVGQLWRVRVDKTFKGTASGTVAVSTTAYVNDDGTLTDKGGAVVPREGGMYVFSGHQDGYNRLYFPFGGKVGTRMSPALGQPVTVADAPRPLQPEHVRGTRSVEECWTTMTKNSVPGPVLH
ncbi:hypothetical protein AB0J38_24420 [Streptomyces sp. NPDC050095]|uniref:hypothetical protein n=1 Tax=unclassified Streptomyces TaxID=2593676 RepID=UPI0034395B99